MRSDQTTFEVIVVGGGGSGLAAAVSAAQRGCEVLLLEKQAQLGGTTGIAVGSFTANRTIYQQRAGIKDDPGAHEEDAARFAPEGIEARNNAELRRYFLSQSAQTLHWLGKMGLVFHGPSPEPPNRVPRMHNVVPGAKAYIAALQSQFLRHGGTILCQAPVEKLRQEQGRVVGVLACVGGVSTAFRAKRGVVLAAGDYANASGLIAEHKGDQFAAIEGINPHAAGDGHRLAMAAGARMINMDITYGPELRFIAPARRTFQQLLPPSGPWAALWGTLLPLAPRWLMNPLIKRLLVTWQHPENSLFDDGAILINARGERFCNERLWPDREIAVAAQPDKIAYILLDQRLTRRYSAWPHFISTAPQIAYAYVADYLRLRPDVALRGESLEELTERRGISAGPLQDSVERFNRYALGQTQDPWGRQRDREALQPGSWVLLGPVKAFFTTTEGGAAIDRHLRVLDQSGNPIEGLYAVGQNGLGGQILWGHGLHIAWALTSGRLVGEALANASAKP